MESGVLGVISWWAQSLAVVFMLVSIVLVILVLLQKGKGGGLSAAFGGMGGQSAFGSKTGDYFTWLTVGVVALFLVLGMVLTVHYVPELEMSSSPSVSAMPGGQPAGPGMMPQEMPAEEASQPAEQPGSTPEAAPSKEQVDGPAEASPAAQPSGDNAGADAEKANP